MAKRVSAKVSVPAGPDAAFEQQCTPEYQVWKLEQMFGTEIEVQVTPSADGGAVIIHTRSMQATLPSVAKKFVGETIRVTETHTWGPAQSDGQRVGTLVAEVKGAPLTVGGELALRTTAEGSAVEVVANIKANVPLVGGKLEELVGDMLVKAVNKESELAAEWLAR